jgi:hypothetical protein
LSWFPTGFSTLYLLGEGGGRKEGREGGRKRLLSRCVSITKYVYASLPFEQEEKEEEEEVEIWCCF